MGEMHLHLTRWGAGMQPRGLALCAWPAVGPVFLFNPIQPLSLANNLVRSALRKCVWAQKEAVHCLKDVEPLSTSLLLSACRCGHSSAPAVNGLIL